jgi:hypothetical protein
MVAPVVSYGYETSSLALKEERRLTVSERSCGEVYSGLREMN